MNILFITIFGLICFGLGILFSTKGLQKLGKMINDMKQAADEIESLDISTIDPEQFNIKWNEMKNRHMSSNITILHDLERKQTDAAKCALIEELDSDYSDINEYLIIDDSPESEKTIARIQELSKHHESFRKIIDRSEWND